MGKSVVTGPKIKILDAAEHAFADFGFDGASLRHIVLEAGVNLATVYYYFGSKEGLMGAVLKRRFGPLRREHLELMKQFEKEARGKPVAVEKILEAMILPPLRFSVTFAAKSPAIMRLIGRIVSEPNVQAQAFLRRQYQDVKTIFLEAFRRSLPEIPVSDLQWRIQFVWGAMAFILTNPDNIKEKTDGMCDPLDSQTVKAQMIKFFSAGFRVPATV